MIATASEFGWLAQRTGSTKNRTNTSRRKDITKHRRSKQSKDEEQRTFVFAPEEYLLVTVIIILAVEIIPAVEI